MFISLFLDHDYFKKPAIAAVFRQNIFNDIHFTHTLHRCGDLAATGLFFRGGKIESRLLKIMRPHCLEWQDVTWQKSQTTCCNILPRQNSPAPTLIIASKIQLWRASSRQTTSSLKTLIQRDNVNTPVEMNYRQNLTLEQEPAISFSTIIRCILNRGRQLLVPHHW